MRQAARGIHAAAVLLSLLAAAAAATAATAGSRARRHLAAVPSAQPGTAASGLPGTATDGGAATDHGSEGLPATDHGSAASVALVPAPEPEAEPLVPPESAAAGRPQAAEAAPAPASPAAPPEGQSLGSKLGAPAKGERILVACRQGWQGGTRRMSQRALKACGPWYH